MTAIPGHQAKLRIILTLATAATTTGFGCNTTPPPASPAPGAQSASSASPAAAPVGPTLAGAVLVSSTGKPPVSGGVVYLEDAPRQPGVATTATVDVHNKEFTPFIAVVTTGGTVTFGNKDALTHHVFSPDLQKWDTGYLKKGETAVRTFDSPGPVALLCNIHPEMVGYVLVIPSTYFGKLGPDGKYLIASVPPGTYRATVWSPGMPVTTQSVTVPPESAATANFELRPATVK